MALDQPYDYTASGFDAFLSRSVDELVQSNLDSPGPTSRTIAFDRGQMGGALPDVVRIGSSITLDGPSERIMLSDGQTNRFLLGYQKDGF